MQKSVESNCLAIPKKLVLKFLSILADENLIYAKRFFIRLSAIGVIPR